MKKMIIGLVVVMCLLVSFSCAPAPELEPPPSVPAPTPMPTPVPGIPDFHLSPPDGHVGSEITVWGTGFTSGREVAISYDDIVVATAKVDKESFLTSFTITQSLAVKTEPSRYKIGEEGQHAVTATDGIKTVTAVFYMDYYPPPTPWPTLPREGTRAVSQTHFEWGYVRDPSGVTYNLQVCTNRNFRDEDLVLEKRGLNVPEYTLSKGERLESTGKRNPYYWRVLAEDGAENMSSWSAATWFYVD